MIIRINALSEKSWKDAEQKVNKYRNDFANKNREFVRQLLAKGIKVISMNNAPLKGDSEPIEPPKMPLVRMGVHEGIMQATLSIRGKDVMFVEFGAGIAYNGPAGTSPNPFGVELGYTIGSYGLGQGRYDEWQYRDDAGEIQVSRGTQAAMPLATADMAIRNEFKSIADKVFRS